MDITKFNFEEELDNIKKAIEESTFLAIDGEFTGLTSGLVARLGRFDTPAEYYRKNRDGASDFLLIQFGLCAFKAIEGEKRYEAKPYNFYIFPSPSDNQSPDRRFLCQASSIDFLTSHDFDFNKLFKEGISYLTTSQEAKLRASLEQKQAERNNTSLNSSLLSPTRMQEGKKSFVVPPEHKTFIEKIQKQVDEYLQSDEKEPLALAPCNAFLRRLIYRAFEQNNPMVHLETKTGEKKERFISISKCADEKDMEEKEKLRQEMELMKLDIQVGFSKVMRMITESGKLVVGHNMYLDVLHTVNHFYEPAPPELEDFKEMISAVLPRLLDTKLMANTSPFKEYFAGTGLEELKYTVNLPPFKKTQIDLPEAFSSYNDSSAKFHQAGYDAYVTGSCFASLINFLGRYQHPSVNFLLPTNAALQPFVNKLFMMYVSDIPYVNLSGPDVEPCRDHVFHITFPKEWRASDLHQLFEPYGNIQISWLSNTAAYVGLINKDKAKLAMSSLCQGSSSFQVVSYANHRLMLEAMAFASTQLTTEPKKLQQSLQKSATKRKSSPPPSGADTVYPPTKLQRRSSLIKDSTSYPPIPEEDEQMDDDSDKEKNALEQNKEGEEDVGVPVSVECSSKTKNKDCLKASGDNQHTTSNGDKLFEEPDNW